MGLFGSKKKINNTDDDFFFTNNDGNAAFEINDTEDSGEKPRPKKRLLQTLVNTLVPILVIIAIIGAVFFGYASITGPRKGECKEVLNNFERACNKLDLNEMADCLEPSLCNKIKAAILVTEVITNQDVNDLAGLIVEGIGAGFIPDTGDTTLEVSDILKTISIEPVKYGFPGKTRVVKCRVSVAGITEYVNFTMKKADGDVFIAKAALAKGK